MDSSESQKHWQSILHDYIYGIFFRITCENASLVPRPLLPESAVTWLWGFQVLFPQIVPGTSLEAFRSYSKYPCPFDHKSYYLINYFETLPFGYSYWNIPPPSNWRAASCYVGKYFSKLDLRDAHLQLPLDTASKQYIAINTHRGLFQYNHLLFGVAPATVIFQHYMEMFL